jgi:hypothetical protein
MSKIDDLIKNLQTKKKKIDYLSYIADTLKNDTKCIDYKEVKAEVLSKLEPLILELMERIENDIPEAVESKTSSPSPFSQAEADALKLMATKILNKGTQFTQEGSTPQPQVQPKERKASVVPVPDKMNFAMDNRHLANRKVSVMNDQNVQIEGTVVGLDAPDVVVKTTSGPTIKVPLEKVVLQ